jgi:hypothetical protein
MKKILLPAFCCLAMAMNAQKTICFQDKTVETSRGKFQVTNGVSQDEYIKAKVTITNLTDKILVIKPEESYYTTPQAKCFSKDRWMVIASHDQESKVIDAKGYGIKTNDATLNLSVYTCREPEVTSAPPIPLKPKKEIQVGNFRLTLDMYEESKTGIVFKFSVKYTGDKLGQCRPGKAMVKSASGGEFKNSKETDRVVSFMKDEEHLVGFTFYVDKKQDYTLYLNDMLTELTPESPDNTTIQLQIDDAKTKEKNK